jgi:membrane associated rhomboid family serine protease
VLIAINVVVFVVTITSGVNPFSGQGTSSLFDRFALIPPAVAHGEWWRLVSSMFLHFTVWHIGFNMWALWVIGGPLEQMLGRARFVALYVLSGFGGGILSLALGPLSETAAGASGAIFGLFGAFYVIMRRRGLETGGIVGLIVINLVFSFTFTNIDWRGHVGGLVVGSVVALVFAWTPAGPSRDRVQAVGCAVVAVALAAAGFVGARHVDRECRTAVGLDGLYCAHYDPLAVGNNPD